jgi:D-alanyl-D-alanine carboxypeptidase/D-alanyl-D-alanine-endopeptidase (penicillin-binding protein 4)
LTTLPIAQDILWGVARLAGLLGVPALVRRLLPLIVLAALAAGASPAGASPESALRGSLGGAMASAGSGSGALVVDVASGSTLFARRADFPRVPASNEKLYTTASSLLRFGADGRLDTRVLGSGTVGADGTYTGNVYLRGGGDPTFGTDSFVRRAYGVGPTVADLADQLSRAGIVRVRGDVIGDESLFDRRRGGPSSGYGFDPYVGAPLSALAFNRGLADESGSSIQSRPATFAADQLRRALRAAGVSVTGRAGEGTTPANAKQLAIVRSPTIATLIRFTNVPSDNYLAEMLLKDLGARFGTGGSTAGGAGAVRATVARFAIAPRVVDGSGLSIGNRTTPRQIVRLLARMANAGSLTEPFRASLAVACRSGTLASRMCGSAASGRCRGKTGTLTGVSALSGYCTLPGGRTIAFSFLMNGVDVYGARSLQNRMAIAIARYRPAAVPATARSAGR